MLHDLLNQAGLSEEALIRVYDIDHGVEIEEHKPIEGSKLPYHSGVSSAEDGKAYIDRYGYTDDIDTLREIKGAVDKDAQLALDRLHPEWKQKPSWSEKLFNMFGVND
jgi:hypothetical protein